MKRLSFQSKLLLPWQSMPGHDNDVLASCREMNKELIVTTFSDIPEEVVKVLEQARENILQAIRLLDPLKPGTAAPVEELPIAEFKAKVSANAEEVAKVFPLPKDNQRN